MFAGGEDGEVGVQPVATSRSDTTPHRATCETSRRPPAREEAVDQNLRGLCATVASVRVVCDRPGHDDGRGVET